MSRMKDEAQGHIRLLNISRDLGEVADLLERAFSEHLDETGRRMVRELRWYARLAPVLGPWLAMLMGWGHQFISFIWEEKGRVVGHVMAMRVPSDEDRWQIVNVAVAAPYRGRGIARALMERLLDTLEDMGGTWAILQVRDDNPVALHLYESLGFEPVCGEIHWVWETRLLPGTDIPRPKTPLLPVSLRRSTALCSLIDRSFTPGGMWWWRSCPSFRGESMGMWLARILGLAGEERWGYWEDGRLLGLVSLRFDRTRRLGQFLFRIDRMYWGQWEETFVRWGLIRARHYGLKRITVVTEMAHSALVEALERSGFRSRHRLLNMRLRLPRQVKSVKSTEKGGDAHG